MPRAVHEGPRLKISIITAVFNGEHTIGTTLASIAEQDHPDIEHIVVDGASSDTTLAQIRAGDRRGARVVSEPDHGAYDAFNKGLRLATGEVIGFLNCGDSYISPATVARIAAGFAGSDAQAVFGDVLIVDERTPGRVVRRYRSHRFTPRAMSYGLMPAHPTLFMRREVYRAVGEVQSELSHRRRFRALRARLCVPAYSVPLPARAAGQNAHRRAQQPRLAQQVGDHRGDDAGVPLERREHQLAEALSALSLEVGGAFMVRRRSAGDARCMS